MSEKEKLSESEGVQEKDHHPTRHGVLLSDAIKYYIDNYGLIEDWDEECIQPASYDLRLGELYAVGGKRGILSEEKPFLEIPPHEVAIASTYEKIKMPRFLIGRWGSRIKWTYEGLVWAGGPQVDPGYHGRLLCPLFNLSTKPVTLKYKQRIVSMDFVKTTPFTKNKCKEYGEAKDINEYKWDMASAPADLWNRVRKNEDEIEKFRESIRVFRHTTFIVLSLIISAIALISATPILAEEPPYASTLFILIGVLVIIALVLIIFAASRKALEWVSRRLN